MTDRPVRRSFAARPADPESWVKSAERTSPQRAESSAFTARLTIDVTPELRGRIKIAAFGRGITVADMLRALLEREFPPDLGERP